MLGPKSESVTAQGESDGWEPAGGFVRDRGANGRTQLVVSVPVRFLAATHQALVEALAPPLGVLYRQVVDRQDPKPEGFPARDFVALELEPSRVVRALARHTTLLHHDARCEIWVRGGLGDQVILDRDGLIFCQPDDPAFEDVLLGLGLSAEASVTIADRDYVKHWFHSEADAHEAGLIQELGLTEIAFRG